MSVTFPQSLDCRMSRHSQCERFDTTNEGRRYCGCQCHPAVTAAEYRLSVQYKRGIDAINKEFPAWTPKERADFQGFKCDCRSERHGFNPCGRSEILPGAEFCPVCPC